MTARRRWRGAALGALAMCAAGAAVSACGVPNSPSAIGLPANDRVVAGSTTTTSSSTTTTVAKTQTNHQTTVYFFRSDGLLTGVRRAFPSKVTPDDVLFLLWQGPYATEKNLTTAVPTGAAPKVNVRRGIAHVPLDGGEFGALYATALSDALGQIVITLMTNFPAIKGVQFILREPGLGPLPFDYTPAGTTVPGPVTIQTYASLLPVEHPTSGKKG